MEYSKIKLNIPKGINDKDILFVECIAKYKSQKLVTEEVFCKKQIDYFIRKYSKKLTVFKIPKNSKEMIVVEMKVLKYLGKTMVK